MSMETEKNAHKLTYLTVLSNAASKESFDVKEFRLRT